jgi:hypothetical protein
VPEEQATTPLDTGTPPVKKPRPWWHRSLLHAAGAWLFSAALLSCALSAMTPRAIWVAPLSAGYLLFLVWHFLRHADPDSPPRG